MPKFCADILTGTFKSTDTPTQSEVINLELSRRRAATVKDALVTQYKIGSDRLATAGYAKPQPKDTRMTLSKAARANRRGS